MLLKMVYTADFMEITGVYPSDLCMFHWLNPPGSISVQMLDISSCLYPIDSYKSWVTSPVLQWETLVSNFKAKFQELPSAHTVIVELYTQISCLQICQ